MKRGNFMDEKKERHHHGGHCHEKGHEFQPRGAKTFRRGRAIAFLEMMQVKRTTVKRQLEEPEFESIRQILTGELKAMDMIMDEFIRLFDIHESEVDETADEQKGDKEEENEAD